MNTIFVHRAGQTEARRVGIDPKIDGLAANATDIVGLRFEDAEECVEHAGGTHLARGQVGTVATKLMSHAAGNVHSDDIYHRDVDDFRFIKLFVYLTDTSSTTGAHSFIKGSHQGRKWAARKALSNHCNRK